VADLLPYYRVVIRIIVKSGVYEVSFLERVRSYGQQNQQLDLVDGCNTLVLGAKLGTSKSTICGSQYVVSKALDGLFYTLGQEEKKIRKDPVARTTSLLKEVFGK